MPLDAYLQIDGVRGEAEAKGLENSIQINTFSWGASTLANMGGKGMGSGKIEVTEFNCSFNLDSSCFQVLRCLGLGTHISSAQLNLRKTGGDGTPYTYFRVSLAGLFLTKFDIDGPGSEIIKVSLSMTFNEVKMDYLTQDTKTGATTLAGSTQVKVKEVAVA